MERVVHVLHVHHVHVAVATLDHGELLDVVGLVVTVRRVAHVVATLG